MALYKNLGVEHRWNDWETIVAAARNLPWTKKLRLDGSSQLLFASSMFCDISCRSGPNV
jgi:hypothetical protein